MTSGENKRRRLEQRDALRWILLGACLPRKTRHEIIAAIPAGLLGGTLEKVIRKLEANEPAELKSLLGQLGAHNGNGDAVQTVIAGLKEIGKREEIDKRLAELEFAKKFETSAELAARMKQIMELLDN